MTLYRGQPNPILRTSAILIGLGFVFFASWDVYLGFVCGVALCATVLFCEAID